MKPFLTRHEAAAYLSAQGLPTTYGLLSKLVVIGGGPLFSKWGKRVVYDAADLDVWMVERLGKKHASTTV